MKQKVYFRHSPWLRRKACVLKHALWINKEGLTWTSIAISNLPAGSLYGFGLNCFERLATDARTRELFYGDCYFERKNNSIVCKFSGCRWLCCSRGPLWTPSWRGGNVTPLSSILFEDHNIHCLCSPSVQAYVDMRVHSHGYISRLMVGVLFAHEHRLPQNGWNCTPTQQREDKNSFE